LLLLSSLLIKDSILRNLTAAEDRIRKLEAAFADLLPHVDINSIVSSSSSDAPRTPGHSDAALAAKPEAAASVLNLNLRENASAGAEETLPQQPDGFDWVEETTLNEMSDGMAALSIKPEGIGYLGRCFSI
jgi:transcriptional regulatory protein GAL4